MIKTTRYLFLCALLAGSGCSDQQQLKNLQSEVTDAKQKIALLEVQVEELKVKFAATESLKKDISRIKESREVDSLLSEFERIAFLTPAKDGYSTIRFGLGSLTVALADVEQYANGSRIILRFGNPLAAEVQGLHAKIDYGPMDENGHPVPGGSKSKDVTFLQALKGGSWTRVPVTLDGVPPDKLGFVRVHGLDYESIFLSNNK